MKNARLTKALTYVMALFALVTCENEQSYCRRHYHA